MAWTTPTDRATGYLVTSVDWNIIEDNLSYLHGDSGTVDLTAGNALYEFRSAAVTGSAVGNVGFLVNSSGDTQARAQFSAGGVLSFGSGSSAVDTLVLRASTGKGLLVENFVRTPRVTLTYGTTVAVDASLGSFFSLTVTNTTAFTIALPTNPPQSTETQQIHIEVFNNSGGTAGLNFASGYVLPSGVVTPNNTFHSLFSFNWNGSKWIGFGASNY